MIIYIHGKNIEITDVINNAVKKSLERLERFSRFITFDTTAKVEIRSYHENLYKVKVSINLAHNKHLQCEVKNSDLYFAIKQTVNPLTQQLDYLKTKSKNKDFIKLGQAVVKNEEETSSSYKIEDIEE